MKKLIIALCALLAVAASNINAQSHSINIGTEMAPVFYYYTSVGLLPNPRVGYDTHMPAFNIEYRQTTGFALGLSAGALCKAYWGNYFPGTPIYYTAGLSLDARDYRQPRIGFEIEAGVYHQFARGWSFSLGLANGYWAYTQQTLPTPTPVITMGYRPTLRIHVHLTQ